MGARLGSGVRSAQDACRRKLVQAENGRLVLSQQETIDKAYVWRADYAQSLVERHYRRLVPDFVTPVKNLFISSMAQVYPEDRGTNYAVRNGIQAANIIVGKLRNSALKALTATA